MSSTVAQVKDLYDRKRNKNVVDLNRSITLYVVIVMAPPTAKSKQASFYNFNSIYIKVSPCGRHLKAWTVMRA